MYQFKFSPTEELAADLFRLSNSNPNPGIADYEKIAKRHRLEAFAHEGKLTLGCKEDMKHHVTGHVEAGFIQTNIPYEEQKK